MAAAVASVVLGSSVVVMGGTSASAVVTVNVTSGNDLTQFSVSSTEGCPEVSEAVVAAVGPGSDFRANGEGFFSTVPATGGFTTDLQQIANLRTATPTFGVAPFPAVYSVNLYCIPSVGDAITTIPLATLTITSIGDTGTTWTIAPIGDVQPTTAAPTTAAPTTASPTTASPTTRPVTATTASPTTRPATTTAATSTSGVTNATTPAASTTVRTTSGTPTTTPRLADTGSDGTDLAGPALALIACGVLALVAARRRATTASHRG